MILAIPYFYLLREDYIVMRVFAHSKFQKEATALEGN